VQRAPVDHDLSAADAEKPAEIDYRGARAPATIDNDINDPAHILVRGTANVTAKNSVGIHGIDHCDRRRR
jgi:hypothetical protein